MQPLLAGSSSYKPHIAPAKHNIGLSNWHGVHQENAGDAHLMMQMINKCQHIVNCLKHLVKVFHFLCTFLVYTQI